MVGAWLGNQQFTVQDCSFEKCQIAIDAFWCWTFVYHRIAIKDCQTAIRVTAAMVDGKGETAQAVSSIACLDWDVQSTPVAVDIISDDTGARGSVVLSNFKTANVDSIVVRSVKSGQTVLLAPPDAGSTSTNWSWQGDNPPAKSTDPATGPLTLPRPTSMLDSSGQWHVQPRPDYLDLTASEFLSARDYGAAGDGVHDDTAALQAVLRDSAGSGKVVWLPHGDYVITDTLIIPSGSRIVGEVFPVLLGTGSKFEDASAPRPVIQVGEQDGQTGRVEISDCIFSTKGPTPGAIVLRWCLAGGPTSGMWDTHIRLGGCAGTNLDDERFSADKPIDTTNAWAAFMAWHITPRASGCFVNNWVWLADHLLDTSGGRNAGKQLSLLAGRGIFIESNPGPVWLWGGASEHFLLYQYQMFKAQNVFIGHAQTETPYFLGEGVALPTQLAKPITTGAPWYDPDWKNTPPPQAGDTETFNVRSSGMRVIQSWSVHIYGPGLYSLFDAYSQDRLPERRCQRGLLSIEGSNEQDVVLVNLNTIGVRSMIDVDGVEKEDEKDHRNGLPSTLGY